ncbi:uncharacterized protein LOC110424741 isoform X1 [Herrania umbratica]|uniref:Uncharacterized protein LOC110424741 isoform X1 n=1 Tax=Herrania umbratica TaxID=108875 RepID=A0A6J1B781_9ROSI|nr:uncharacterized protein LOC110424741 isoform X1 [Herrania umbratica]
MANVCCSIETEPRTLNQGQLSHAMEMAADVAQKLEPREASAIFIEMVLNWLLQGLISATEIKEVELADKEKEVECNQRAQVTERPCQCSCDNMESPDTNNILNNLKEPVTAPF